MVNKFYNAQQVIILALKMHQEKSMHVQQRLNCRYPLVLAAVLHVLGPVALPVLEP